MEVADFDWGANRGTRLAEGSVRKRMEGRLRSENRLERR